MKTFVSICEEFRSLKRRFNAAKFGTMSSAWLVCRPQPEPRCALRARFAHGMCVPGLLVLMITLFGFVGCGPTNPRSAVDVLASLGAQAQRDHGRIVAVSFKGTVVKDSDLAQLGQLNQLHIVELYGTSITDDGLAHLQRLSGLTGLGLSGTRITDDGLRYLEGFRNLETLYLLNTHITDEGLMHLKHLSRLKSLDITGTNVSSLGVNELSQAIPNCQIVGVTMAPQIAQEPSTSRPAKQDGAPTVPVISRRMAKPAPSVRRTIKQVPLPEDIEGDVELSWSTPFGEGGALVPQLPEPRPAEGSGLTFSRLLGVVFPQNGYEILFVGVDEPGLPHLLPSELMDAFIVAIRSVVSGQAPGVTFEPRLEQLARGVREDDLMDVTYFGEVEEANVGFACYEADRTMKCLAAGKDNITKQPVTCNVPGYISELDRLVNSTGRRSHAWHRLWIEVLSGMISPGENGRAFLADIKLVIKTHIMRVNHQTGELEDDPDGKADPATEEFVKHLSDHYFDYARELPVFAKVAAYATLTSIAEALFRPSEANAGMASASVLRNLSLDAVQHRVKPQDTPRRTPATIASRERPIANGREIVKLLTGGVDLTPKNRYRPPSSRIEEFRRAVLAGRPQGKDQRHWSADFEGRTLNVVATRPSRQLCLRQEDLQAGALRVVRDYSPDTGMADFGKGWVLRRPRLRVAKKTVTLEDRGVVPQNVSIQFQPDRRVVLGQPTTMTIPGSTGPVLGYMTKDRTARIALYKNMWLYLEGDVQFVSRNNGPIVMELQPGARVIQFSPEDTHHVESVQTTDRQINYSYQNGRLSFISDSRNTIRFVVDEQGLIESVVGDNGNRVHYGRDSAGCLRAVTDDAGDKLSYEYATNGTPMAIDLPAGSSHSEKTTEQFAVTTSSEPLGVSPAVVQRLADQNAVVISVKFENNRLVVDVNGKPYARDVDLIPLLEQSDYGVTEELAKYVDNLLPQQDVSVAVLTGAMDWRARLADPIKKLRPHLFVATAENPERAEENLRQPGVEASMAEIEVQNHGVEHSYRVGLSKIPSAPGSPILIIAAHNDRVLIESLHTMGEAGRFDDKYVVLATCGSTQLAQTVKRIVGSHRARDVISFDQPIDQALLEPFVAGLQKRLTNYKGAISQKELDLMARQTTEEIDQKVRKERKEERTRDEKKNKENAEGKGEGGDEGGEPAGKSGPAGEGGPTGDGGGAGDGGGDGGGSVGSPGSTVGSKDESADSRRLLAC